MDRERDGDVAAGPDRQMNVGAARQRGGTRIDHDQLGAALLRLADEWNDVNPRCRRVHAPEDDQLRLGVILVGDRRHLAVERQIGGAGRRGADRAREPRGAEPPPQLRVDVVLREHAVRSAVRIRQDRLGARGRLGLFEAGCDQLDRFVPGDARELAGAFASAADGGVQQAIGSVDALAELAHLGADVAVGDRVPARPVDRDDLAGVHGDGQAARVRTVQRTRGLDDRGRAAELAIRFARCRHTDTIASPNRHEPTEHRCNLLPRVS